MTSEELDLAVSLIVEVYGRELTRSMFDEAAKDVVPTIGLLDRLWARYLLARRP